MPVFKFLHMEKLTINEPFLLQSGKTLPSFELAYSTFGTLNEDKSNVIWVCHALSGNSDVSSWWAGIFGSSKALDPDRYFIVCANVLGSCYGTTGPLSQHLNAELLGRNFPNITIDDIVKGHQLLAKHLKIESVFLLVGASLGGQQALQWVVDQPNFAQNLVLIASNAVHSPWGIAFNEAQRLALLADESFRKNDFDGGKNGLKAARAIALLSYRSYRGFGASQHEEHITKTDEFRAASYLQYQGDKFVNRFNAYAYWALSKAMDAHNVGRKYASVTTALSRVQSRTLVIGVDSDLLFPISEQTYLAQHLPDCELEIISSLYGHDGFLTETEKVDTLIQTFIKQQK